MCGCHLRYIKEDGQVRDAQKWKGGGRSGMIEVIEDGVQRRFVELEGCDWFEICFE